MSTPQKRTRKAVVAKAPAAAVARGGKNASNAANNAAASKETTHRNYISVALAEEVLASLHGSATIDDYPSAKQVQASLEAFINYLINKTMIGESTTITNFATFSRVVVAARDHKNPQDKLKTGPPVHVGRHYKMRVEIKPKLRSKMHDIPLEGEDKKAK